MMKTPLLSIVIALVVLVAHHSAGEERYVENYVETDNCARIFDWGALELLQTTKVTKAVKIDAKSSEELVAQLEKVMQGIEGAPKIRFVFPRELWEIVQKDGTVHKTPVSVTLNLEDEDVPNLLKLLIWVSELNSMTFSVKKEKIIFRPLVG